MGLATLAALFACGLSAPAFAWGQEGHSIIAEIAQHRLSPDAAAMVELLLGKGHSLASIASWADDARDARPETGNWHFVSIPLARDNYDEAADCHPADEATKGDCVVNELKRLRNELHCTSGDQKVEALKFAVHFVGDVHQPLHAVLEKTGGNDILIDLFARGDKCTGSCLPQHDYMKFHAAWDSGLILGTVWDWGRYVDRLETGDGWLTTPEARASGIDGGTPGAMGGGDPQGGADRLGAAAGEQRTGRHLLREGLPGRRPPARRRRPSAREVPERRLRLQSMPRSLIA